MALYDINEYLTLNDVAEYLTDKCSYDFDLECSIDQNRLIETIIQLVRNDKLHPVFHYSGSVDFLEKKVITSKSGRFINHEMVLLNITGSMSVRDYYFLSDKNFDKLIENNCSNYINIINCTIEPYHIDGKQEIVENNILYYREIKEDFSIIFHDLLYPKLDLDKLFNQTDTAVIEKPRQKVADLQNELAQAKTEIEDKSADDNKELNPKDSAYHLIAVLKDLLLDPNTTPYMFKTDNQKSTNQPTQAGLAEYIDAMNLKGLKARNINGMFSDANRLLSDLKKY
ncbi:hypothetical protein I6E61_12785 [Psychrobacter sp. NZS113]|uniref:hypothetical protein n=1 Tax=Psychrobacter sp. NZS113 TaxID=2792045 RepID=UPI0018CF1EC0|nr:hypothetical protein [Psychrobacter sp. NZS113]MBH0097263.1 hypothetical protein [Psychrobacter sp. NZS113]